MARDLSTFQSVTRVAAETGGVEQLVAGAAELGAQVIDTSQKAKVAESLSNTQLELLKLNNEIKTQYESDPARAEQEYMTKRQALFQKNAQAIPAMYRGLFTSSANNIQQNDNLAFESWKIKQSQKNTVNSVNKSIKNSLDIAYEQGFAFGENGETDISMLLNYGNARGPIEGFAASSLGPETANTLLEDFDRDYTKQILNGLSRSNPMQAAELIEDPAVKEAIGSTEDYLTLKDSISVEVFKFSERQDFNRLTDEAIQNAGIFERRADGDLNYLEVEELSRSGAISPALATQLKKGLLNPNEAATTLEKYEMTNALFEDYERLVTSDGKSRVDTMGDFIAFQEKYVEAVNAGALTKSEAKKFSSVQRAFAEKFKVGGGASSMWGLNSPYSDDPLYTSFKAINGFMSNNSALETPENRQQLFMSALGAVDLEELETMPEADKQTYLVDTAKKTVKNFLVNQYPELAGIDELPSKVPLSNGTILRIPRNLADAKTNTDVKTPSLKLKDRYIGDDGTFVSIEEIRAIAASKEVSVEEAVRQLLEQGIIK